MGAQLSSPWGNGELSVQLFATKHLFSSVCGKHFPDSHHTLRTSQAFSVHQHRFSSFAPSCLENSSLISNLAVSWGGEWLRDRRTRRRNEEHLKPISLSQFYSSLLLKWASFSSCKTFSSGILQTEKQKGFTEQAICTSLGRDKRLERPYSLWAQIFYDAFTHSTSNLETGKKAA